MSVWKGGRGVKAPYESTHVRVPLPVKEKVEAIIQAFKDGEVEESQETELSEEDMIQIAKNILKQKKSAKISLEAFLKTILKKEVSL